MRRSNLRRTSVLAVTAASAGVGIVLSASAASADVYSNIRACESGGNYSTDTGNGYYGAYQFSQSTWSSLGYPGVPSSASPATQDAAAAQLAARSGFGQWPVCGAGGGSAPAASYTAPAQPYTSYAPISSPVPAAAPVADVRGFFSTANVNEVRADVRSLQKALVKMHYKLTVDGQYGTRTESAVVKFQKAKKLKFTDGVVGRETWQAAGLK